MIQKNKYKLLNRKDIHRAVDAIERSKSSGLCKVTMMFPTVNEI